MSLNLYAYCANNPLIYYDPTGHNWVTNAWNSTKNWATNEWGKVVEGYEILSDPQKREEAFKLIDEYGDLSPVEKRLYSVAAGYGEISAGMINTGKAVLDSGYVQKPMLEVGRALGVGGLDNDLVYNIAKEEIDNKLQSNKETLNNAPSAIYNGIITDFKHVINKENAYNFFCNPDTSFSELVDYSRSGISTGMTVYGGAKLLQSTVAITKAGVLGIKQTAINVANSGLKPLAVGGYGSSVAGMNNINNAIIQMGKSGVQMVAPNVSKITNPSGISGGKLPERIPTVKSGEFNDWFNSLTPEELNTIWQNKALRKAIERELRAPGGMHEWHMVSRAPTFKKWGITAEQIRNLRTAIDDVKFVNPTGAHGKVGSTTAHNEILKIIDSSSNYDDFVQGLNNWASERLDGGINSLPEGLRR